MPFSMETEFSQEHFYQIISFPIVFLLKGPKYMCVEVSERLPYHMLWYI